VRGLHGRCIVCEAHPLPKDSMKVSDFTKGGVILVYVCSPECLLKWVRPIVESRRTSCGES
jgi:hypothetical protein